MPKTYEDEVDERSHSRLNGTDLQRTRLSNDYVRDSYKRKERWASLLGWIVTAATVGAALAQIIHYIRGGS